MNKLKPKESLTIGIVQAQATDNLTNGGLGKKSIISHITVDTATRDSGPHCLPNTPSPACSFYPYSFTMAAGPLGIVNTFQVER